MSKAFKVQTKYTFTPAPDAKKKEEEVPPPSSKKGKAPPPKKGAQKEDPKPVAQTIDYEIPATENLER